MAETKTVIAEKAWLAIQAELNPGETPISRTLENISVNRAGLHRVRTEKGRWSYFPISAADEGQWEQRALEMLKNQHPVTLDAKPIENQMTRIVRGD